MKVIGAFFAGTLVCLVTGTVIAIAMQPFVAPLLAPHIRTEDQGLLFPALLSGYVVFGAMLTALAVLTEASGKRWIWVLQTGAVVGLAIFLGDHLITAGWSQLAALPMAASGILDSLSILAGFCAVTFVLKRGAMAT